MKILIVNGYSKSAQGMKAFADFQFNIQRIFSKQRVLVDTETEFFIRDTNNLDDFLYELDNSYVIKSSGKLFDHMDLIFITGDPFLLPWFKCCRKVLLLIRMCLKTQKHLFAASFAFMCYVYLCSTNFEQDIQVVNGRQKGALVGDLSSLDKSLADINPTDYFLDNATGDLYSHNSQQDKWVLHANIGLHYQKTSLQYMKLGKYNIKLPLHQNIQPTHR